MTLLQQLSFTVSSPLHPRTLEAQPQVVQVWIEPSPLTQQSGTTTAVVLVLAPSPVMALHGSVKFAPRDFVWTCRDDRTRLQALLEASGRVMLRVHCGHLMDQKERALSSSVDALTNTKSPHLPAGVFEGWFFVARTRGNTPLRPPVRRVATRPAAAKKTSAAPRPRKRGPPEPG